jgi:Domain of unknown function (DUF4350)
MTAAPVQQTNRKTAFIAFGVALALTAAIAVLTPNQQGGELDTPPSTFFATNKGARAIYRVLYEVLPKTGRWQLPLTELQNHAEMKKATLVALGPPAPISEREANALDAWIREGGQLILATSKTWDIEHARGDRSKRSKPGDYLARHQIYRRPGEGADAIAAAEIKGLGAGRIVYVPDSFAFSNDALSTTDNAFWIATRASEWSSLTMFDEYHHGFAQRRGFFTLVGLFLFSSPWGFVCLQLALAGSIYVLGCKRRFGKIIEEIPTERTSPIEAAEALGGLFQAAQARVLSVKSIHQYVNMELSRMLGHRIDLLNPESRERASRRSTMSKADLDQYAEVVANAFQKPPAQDDELMKIAGFATNILRSLDHGSATSKRHAAAS